MLLQQGKLMNPSASSARNTLSGDLTRNSALPKKELQ
jgi:hypothetical protein